MLKRLAIALGLALAGCGDRQAAFRVKSTPDVKTREGTVSVFGVFRDGRLESSAWEDVGAGFAADTCPVGYDETLRVSHPEIASAIDASARDDGVGDAAMQKLESYAQGDYILLVTLFGRLPTAKERNEARSSSPTFATSQAPARQQGRKGSRPMTQQDDIVPLSGGLQVVTTLYSKREHRTVAGLEMEYTGSTTEGAFAAFWKRWNAEFPGLSCRDWAWPAETPRPD